MHPRWQECHACHKKRKPRTGTWSISFSLSHRWDPVRICLRTGHDNENKHEPRSHAFLDPGNGVGTAHSRGSERSHVCSNARFPPLQLGCERTAPDSNALLPRAPSPARDTPETLNGRACPRKQLSALWPLVLRHRKQGRNTAAACWVMQAVSLPQLDICVAASSSDPAHTAEEGRSTAGCPTELHQGPTTRCNISVYMAWNKNSELAGNVSGRGIISRA